MRGGLSAHLRRERRVPAKTQFEVLIFTQTISHSILTHNLQNTIYNLQDLLIISEGLLFCFSFSLSLFQFGDLGEPTRKP